MTRETTDRDLVRRRLMARAQRGDAEAYRTLLLDVRPALVRVLRPYAAGAEDLDDLAQEVLLTVHRSRRTYDPGRAFAPWLFAIARYVAWEHVKRRHRRQTREVPDETVGERPAAAPVPLARLESALGKLPPAQREAFEMLKVEGLSLKQAAARTGVSVGALKVRAHRAYRALRALLAR